MKVLQICLKPPLPEIDGGCKAMNNITQGLLHLKHEVKVLTLGTHKHPFNKKHLSPEYVAQTKIEGVHINTKVDAANAFFNLFSSKSYNVERFYSKKFEDLIIKTIKEHEFDIIFLESLYVSGYVSAIRKNTKTKIVYRAHNIESEIWRRNASQEKGLKKAYLNLLARRLKKYEQNMLNHFDGIAAITGKDKKSLLQMGCKIPVEVFPFGIAMDDYQMESNLDSNSVFHIGSMDWKPNQEGIKWFLNNIWDDVHKELPMVEFNLAGKGMPGWLLKHHQENVNVIGEVKSANNFINQNGIMVVPLFAASGMRIKIIEGMALGKLIIATSIAAEGIAYSHGENIIIADTKQEFVKAIVDYLKDKEAQDKIAKKARELIETNYDNRLIVNNLVAFFKQIMN